MAEQLAACARELFEGVPGSSEQRAANAWLMQFQVCDEAWQAALQLLEQPPRDAVTGQPLAAPELVAMQILRLKTQQEWSRMTPQQKQIVRQALLKLLGAAACGSDAGGGGLSPVSCRIACVTLADIIVKSCKEWKTWKADIQRLVDAGFAAHGSRGAVLLAETLGAIPLQILLSERLWTPTEMLDVLAIFQPEGDEVVKAVHMILSNVPDAHSSALRCLECWIVGCIPTHESFGLTAVHLFTRGLTDVLFDIASGDNEEQAQLSACVIADSFVYTMSPPASENLVQAVLHAGYRLISAMPVFQSEVRFANGSVMHTEQQTIVCRGLSRVACSLAMNHAAALFSSQPLGIQAVGGQGATENQQQFALQFLEFLLVCSAHDDIDVVQPTLEIWFFFLEDHSSQNEISLQLLGAVGREHVVGVLSRLANALIERCKFPQWFIESQQISSDDPRIEAIVTLRREIADTLLSLFAKWPGGPGKLRGDYVSCVKGMTQMLQDFSDVALIDALLYLLAYMVELFDVVSSDSETDDDQLPYQAPSGGVEVLLEVLNYSPQLPMHPLVVNGVARFLRSLSASLVLPANVYLRTSLMISQGLGFASSFSVAVQSLLHSSSSITKYTDIEERTPLLQTLLSCCNSPPAGIAQESRGDLLEVTFRIASGVSDADFGTLCSSVLSELTLLVQSARSTEARRGVYMLGRAIGGVQDSGHGLALVDQLWALVSAALLHHKADGDCRRAGVQFFLNVIPLLQEGDVHPIETQMLDVCLWWYGEDIAPDILVCCSRIIAKQRGNAAFSSTIHQATERLIGTFRHKLHDDPAVKPEAGGQSMGNFLTQHHNAELLTAEIEQFMRLAREVLSSFPQVLLEERSNGQPTLYWTWLGLAVRLLEIDHQTQEICDAACDFLLDAMRLQPAPILERIGSFTTELVRIVVNFLGSKRLHYRVRNLWDFLFQCLHAPQISAQLRNGFQAAVSVVVLEQGALNSLLPAETCQQVATELASRRQRHRFRQYLSQLARFLETGHP